MIRTALHRLIAGFNALNLYLILPLLVTIILADIVLRFAFNSPLVWAHEVSGLLLICLFFLALPACIQTQQLLQVDIVYHLLGKKTQQALRALSRLLLLGFSILLVCQGYLGVTDSLKYGERAFSIDLPYWPFYGLMSFVGLVCAGQSLLALVSPFNSDASGHKNIANKQHPEQL